MTWRPVFNVPYDLPFYPALSGYVVQGSDLLVWLHNASGIWSEDGRHQHTVYRMDQVKSFQYFIFFLIFTWRNFVTHLFGNCIGIVKLQLHLNSSSGFDHKTATGCFGLRVKLPQANLFATQSESSTYSLYC